MPSIPILSQSVAPGDPQRRTWLLATSAMGVAATATVAVPFVSRFVLWRWEH